MPGILTIHSSASSDGNSSTRLLSGHSWIEYIPENGQATTYGTWGNNPDNLGNGLHEDLELGSTGDVSRTKVLTADEEAKFLSVVEKYKEKGADGWGLLSPCSSFAAEAWNTATGENLNSRRYGIISTPTDLKASIEHANQEDEKKKNSSSSLSSSSIPSSLRSAKPYSSGKVSAKAASLRTSLSSRRVTTACQSCPLSHL